MTSSCEAFTTVGCMLGEWDIPYHGACGHCVYTSTRDRHNKLITSKHGFSGFMAVWDHQALPFAIAMCKSVCARRVGSAAVVLMVLTHLYNTAGAVHGDRHGLHFLLLVLPLAACAVC